MPIVVAPTVISESATNIGTSSVILRGSVAHSGFGVSTTRYFMWGTNSSNLNQRADASGTGSGAFQASITGLSADTVHYYRAFASNGGDLVGQGSTLSVRTDVLPVYAPTVTTNAIIGLGTTTVTLTGAVTDVGNGTVPERYFMWGTSSSNLNNFVQASGAGGGNFQASLTGLTPDTRYHFKAFATNGGSLVGEGTTRSFRTEFLLAPGMLFVWGSELGSKTGIPEAAYSPFRYGGDTWKDVACCSDVTLAIRSDGKLFSAGIGNYGENGLGGAYSDEGFNQIGNENWIAVFGGSYHGLAIREDGKLFAWGYNAFGQLGVGDKVNRNAPVQVGTSNWKALSGGNWHSIGLRSDNKLFAWGSHLLGQSDVPTQIGNDNWTKISAGYDRSSFAIRQDGKLFAWGGNINGQLGIGNRTDQTSLVQVGSGNWIDVSAGEAHTLAISSDKKLYATGSNYYGQLGNGTNNDEISFRLIGSGWEKVSSGINSSFAIRTTGVASEGCLFSWGLDSAGQLGQGGGDDLRIPTRVGSMKWRKVSSMHDHTVGIID